MRQAGAMDTPRVATRRLLAWCGPSLPVAALGLPLIVYLPPYYAGTLGLPLATVGFLFFIVRAIDVPLDPLIGALMDNTRTRWGRFRPWLVAGSVVLMLGVWGLFMARPGATAAATFGWLLLLYLGFSMVMLAQTSWGATLSADYTERARVFGWWTAANVVGLLAVLLIPPLVARLLPGTGPAPGVHAMGWFIIALLPVTALAAVAITGDGSAAHPKSIGGAPGSHAIRWSDARRVLADRRMARLLATDLALSIAPGVAGALFLFFFSAVKGYAPGQASLLLLVYFAAGLAAAPLWVRLAARQGKHRALVIASLWFAASQLALPLLPARSMALALPAMAFAGAAYAAAPFLLRAMLADLADAQRLDGGGDATGLNYALLTATAKIGYGIPVGLTYPLLGLIGFDPAPGAVNDAAALRGLQWMFVAPTVALALLGAWLAWRWPITATAHAAIRAKLDAMTAAK